MEKILKQMQVDMANEFKQACKERERIIKMLDHHGEWILELEKRIDGYQGPLAKIGLR
ncbi:MAG: hypothetical protein V3V74_07250 [Nitrosomonadaceae bacterium]